MQGIWLFGKGELACFTANFLHKSDEFHLMGIIPVTPEPSWTQSLINWADENSVKVLSLEDWRNTSLDVSDIALSVFYDKIFGKTDIQKVALFLNCHNSPLPKYRGVNPINWALENNESTHGVSIHVIDSGIDTGPIVAQSVFSIFPESQEVVDVYNQCIAVGKILIPLALSHGLQSRFKPQDNTQSSYYSKFDALHLRHRKDWRRKK